MPHHPHRRAKVPVAQVGRPSDLVDLVDLVDPAVAALVWTG